VERVDAVKLSKRQHQTLPDPNMTPMIDVVFLLLIFFITVSQISETQREQLNLPQQPTQEEQKQGTYTVNVNRQGDVIVSGSTVTVPELVLLLAHEIQSLGNDPSRMTILVRIDRDARSERPNEVFKALRRMRFNNVRLAVEQPGRE
jgi:biopolymer transport protein ExbD